MKLYKIKNDSIQCLLCPNNCILNSNNRIGLCGIRKLADSNDSIINLCDGIISAEAIDPIEKKPLYHFMPGSKVFSIGFYGCTLKCEFCQNFNISQNIPKSDIKRQSPSELVDVLLSNNQKLIAFTYSEPLLHFEWLLETSKLCKQNNIKTILVTNGYINYEPAFILLDYIDAVNIDLKGFNDTFYKKYIKGKVEPVKEFIKLAYNKNVHTEITTLIIPGLNDSLEEIKEISTFIKSISEMIPFHITAYHPSWKMCIPPTKPEKIIELVELSKKELKFVYGGNIHIKNDTNCIKCNNGLIERNGNLTLIKNLKSNGDCVKCGFNNYIIR